MVGGWVGAWWVGGWVHGGWVHDGWVGGWVHGGWVGGWGSPAPPHPYPKPQQRTHLQQAEVGEVAPHRPARQLVVARAVAQPLGCIGGWVGRQARVGVGWGEGGGAPSAARRQAPPTHTHARSRTHKRTRESTHAQPRQPTTHLLQSLGATRRPRSTHTLTRTPPPPPHTAHHPPASISSRALGATRRPRSRAEPLTAGKRMKFLACVCGVGVCGGGRG